MLDSEIRLIAAFLSARTDMYYYEYLKLPDQEQMLRWCEQWRYLMLNKEMNKLLHLLPRVSGKHEAVDLVRSIDEIMTKEMKERGQKWIPGI